MNTGQSPEYAISTSNAGTGLSTRQSGTTFTGLKSSTTYYVYARSASTSNYDAGTMSAASAAIKTGDVSFTITFAQITDGAPTITGPTISRSGTGYPVTSDLTVASPGDYASIEWFITGTSVTGTGTPFTLNAANTAYNGVGQHFLTLEVVKAGIPYSKQISFTVVQ